MFGWSIIARACRSASKRAMTWWLSMPGLMILSATLRRTGSLLLGHVDDAHAPFADLLEQLVRADDRAGLFRERRGCRGWHGRRSVQDAARGVVGGQEGLDAFPQRVVGAAAPSR